MHFILFLTFFCGTCVSFSVSQNCPVECVCHEGLTNCSNANLSVLPDGIYKQVISLDLSCNNFTTFPANFTDVESLIKLNVSHNYLQTINYGAFEHLTNIKILDLSNNKFKDWRDIKASAFDDLHLLDDLNFSNNNLGNLKFTNIKSLTNLKLENCNLRRLEGIFQPGNILKEVYLSHNNIINIPPLIADKLEILDLTNAGISNITENAFTNVPHLNDLILKNNPRLKNIKLQSTSIVSLDVSGSSLEHIPEGEFTRLEYLDLSRNKISVIRNRSFDKLYTTNCIVTANFSENSISKIFDGAFNNATFYDIDLSFNRISDIPLDLFKSQKKLVKLNLSHNFIQTLSWNIENLVYLDISYNEIKYINVDDFQNMPKLERLLMRRNFIYTIPDYTYIPKIKYLDVSMCKIRKLNNKTFADMYSLRILDLRSNQLSSVHPSYFSKISEVEIKGNPWRCECPTLKAMYEQMVRMQEDVGLICDTPDKVSGKTWKEACYKEWYPRMREDNMWVYCVGIIIAISMILGIIVTIKKISRAKQERLRQLEEERLNQERESLRRMELAQRRAREETIRNAPDPRASIGPPSYIEALSLPRLDASHPSLNSLYMNHRQQQQERSLLTGSNPEISRKKTRRRRRRKSDALSSRRVSAASMDTDTSDDKDMERLRLNNPLESDF